MKNRTMALGVQDGGLAPCPKTANCVSTQHNNLNRRMPPIDYDGLTLQEAKETLYNVLKTLPKIDIQKDDGRYIYAEAKTMVFEFFNDVEFYFDESKKEIHFRSASRMGISDFGANKRRMQAITARFLRDANHMKASH
ncbi:DUF1499 domain-containing protein [Camelliibacillus cellulosilyticus]|uniref:DUF1499 domain-containing protein n=1 Tax=Camelliibacillus cellulosilyticus TaxID=2174486 RepID=A0ABV9GRN5_9BACL